MVNRMDNRIESLIRQWIMLEEYKNVQSAVVDEEEEDIAEVVFLPTGYEVRGLQRAS